MNAMKVGSGHMKDQVAVVTGGVRGIGLGIAKRLAREGCRVVVWDRDVEGCDAAEFAAAALEVVDVSDMASVENSYAATMRQFGRVDILVNNAGINGPVVPTWEYPLEAWDRVLAIDLTGVFYC